MPNPTSLGYGDILFNFYNGDATFRNLQITGSGEFVGIQIRGASPTSNHPMAAGVMTFDYRLRPGVVQNSNALALMRAVGLEV